MLYVWGQGDHSISSCLHLHPHPRHRRRHRPVAFPLHLQLCVHALRHWCDDYCCWNVNDDGEHDGYDCDYDHGDDDDYCYDDDDDHDDDDYYYDDYDYYDD